MNPTRHNAKYRTISTEACSKFKVWKYHKSWIANLGHSDGIPSSLPQCGVRFYYSRTWDKKIPPKEGFLLFLSGTARACLVPRVPVWYRLSGTPFCSFTSVTMTSQHKAQRFPRRQRVSVTLKRTLSACFSLKCISQRGTRKIIKSQCWIQTDKSQSRVIRCHIPVSATASTGICDIVSPSTEICQSGSNSGTWFYYSHSWDRNIRQFWHQKKCCPTLEGETNRCRKY